jgi:hypothetical protein
MTRTNLKLLGNLPSKYGNRQYYKGKGATAEGRHTKHGGYIIDDKLRKHIVAPTSLFEGTFSLKPYVSRLTPKLVQTRINQQQRTLTSYIGNNRSSHHKNHVVLDSSILIIPSTISFLIGLL